MTVKAKLLAALSIILVTAFVTTSMVNYMVTRDAVRDELINSSLPLTGKNIYSDIHAAMMRPILVSSSMANDSFLKDWITDGERDIAQISRYLSDIQDKYGFLTTFFVSHASDKYYYQGGLLKKVNARDPHDVWFYAFTASRQEYDLDVDTNEAEAGKLTIFINFRMEDDDGNLLGVTGVGVNMDQAVAMLNKARDQYKRNVYLVDRDGLVQVHADQNRIEHEYITETPGVRDVAQSILTIQDNAINLEYDRGDGHILLSSRYIEELGWHLVVEQNEGEALATARSNMIRTLSVGLGASVLIILLCGLTVNYFQSRLERLAKTDHLTGTGNRNALEERFALNAYKAERYDNLFSIIIIDLDGFKAINDRLGHLAGDMVIKGVAETIQHTLRPSDFVARWGGDEFIIIMDGNAEEAVIVSERLQKAVSSRTDLHDVSFSCGITRFEKNDSLETMTKRADKAMYRAKVNERHCIVAD